MGELPQQGLFNVIAEVAATFVGFSMIVGLFRRDAGGRARVFATRDVAEVSLVVVAAALLPALIYGFDVPEAATWRWSSLVFSLSWLLLAYLGIRRFVRARLMRGLAKVLWFGPLSQLVAHPLLWWNVLSPGPRSGSRYAVALAIFLAFAGLSFVVATFHASHGEDEDSSQA